MKKYNLILIAAIIVAMTGFYSCDKEVTEPDQKPGDELPPGPGDGSVSNPFKVFTVEDLKRVGSDEVGPGGFKWECNKNYRQMADIDLRTVQSWTPLCNGYNKPFSGTYEGNGKTISNLKILGEGKDVGLFAEVSGTVRNVRLTNIDITGSNNVGGIAGLTSIHSNALIDHCYVNIIDLSGTGSKGNSDIGGIVGCFYSGTISNCIVTGENIRTTTLSNTGGIAGINYSMITNCYVSANVRGYFIVGGIVGSNEPNAIVQYCYVSGEVSAENSFLGGISGTCHPNGNIQNCVALSRELKKNDPNGLSQYIGRICSDDNLSNNYARSDMKLWNNANSVVPSSTDNTSRHGADISSSDYNSASWWKNTAGFPDENWSFDDNRLPWLKGFDGLPQ